MVTVTVHHPLLLRLPLLFAFITAVSANISLETLPDDDILHLIKTQHHAVVFFTKKNCPTCTKWEVAVSGAKEQLEENLSARVVQCVDSSLVRLYDRSLEPSLLFFRGGVPLLYDGNPEADDIVSHFTHYKDPLARELTDDTFERLTQAASGATTGDWFVMFYSSSCVECQRLTAVWEAVGAAVKDYGVVVARADRGGLAVATAKRFKVTEDPTFILFRRGKMYWYDFGKYDIKSLSSFSLDWYKNAKSENVPLSQTPFDEFVLWCVNMIKFVVELVLTILSERPWIWQIGLAGFGLVGLTSIIALVKARSHLKQN